MITGPPLLVYKIQGSFGSDGCPPLNSTPLFHDPDNSGSSSQAAYAAMPFVSPLYQLFFSDCWVLTPLSFLLGVTQP